MAPLDTEIPPVGEEIHLPGPSVQPILLAFSIMVFLVGVTTTIFFVIAGGIASLWLIVAWIRAAAREMDELPLDEHQG